MEEVRFSSRIIHPEVLPVSREELQENVNKTPRVTTPFYTKYEYTALIGIRAQQIAEGAKPLISIDGMITSSSRFVWDVAEKEVLDRKLPFIVHRRFPSGISEYWSTTELSVIW